MKTERGRYSIPEKLQVSGLSILKDENWRWVDGYEYLYAISSLGRVASFRRMRATIKKPFVSTPGYLVAQFKVKGLHKNYSVHRLVAEAFLGKSDLHVNHIDGNKKNNFVSNLEWTSVRDNVLHAYELGTIKRGAQHPHSKLSRSQIISIRNSKDTITHLARMYNVGWSTIKRIKRRETYTDV